ETRSACINDEGADTTGGPLGEGHDRVCDATIRDQVLDAVEREMVSAPFVGHLHFERIAAGLRFGEPEGEDLFSLGGRRKVAAFLVLIAPGCDRILPDRYMAGKEGPHTRALTTDARQRASIGDGIGAPAAVLRWDQQAKQVVFPTQRQDLLVELVFDVAKLLDGTDFLAKCLYVGKKFLLVGCVHERGTPEFEGVSKFAISVRAGRTDCHPGARL